MVGCDAGATVWTFPYLFLLRGQSFMAYVIQFWSSYSVREVVINGWFLWRKIINELHFSFTSNIFVSFKWTNVWTRLNLTSCSQTSLSLRQVCLTRWKCSQLRLYWKCWALKKFLLHRSSDTFFIIKMMGEFISCTQVLILCIIYFFFSFKEKNNNSTLDLKTL